MGEHSLKAARVTTHICLPVEAEEHENIILSFPKIIEFVETARAAYKTASPDNALIVDDEGISTAATAVLAYMIHSGLDLKSAIKQLQYVYPKAFPNKGFFQQLLEYESEKLGSKSLSASDFPRVFEQPTVTFK